MASHNRGYTLLEMIAVTSILSVVGLVSSFVIFQSLAIYARTSPAMQAAYQARLATERITRDIRAMKDTASIAALTPTALSFLDESDQPLELKLSGSDLFRNGDLLAQNLSGFALSYWTSDGRPAANAGELHLVSLDLTTNVGGQAFNSETVVFPRCLGP